VADEEKVLPAQSGLEQGTLAPVVVQRQTLIRDEAAQRFPLLLGIGNGLAQRLRRRVLWLSVNQRVATGRLVGEEDSLLAILNPPSTLPSSPTLLNRPFILPMLRVARTRNGSDQPLCPNDRGDGVKSKALIALYILTRPKGKNVRCK
jgi:hypothetical protein